MPKARVLVGGEETLVTATGLPTWIDGGQVRAGGEIEVTYTNDRVGTDGKHRNLFVTGVRVGED